MVTSEGGFYAIMTTQLPGMISAFSSNQRHLPQSPEGPQGNVLEVAYRGGNNKDGSPRRSIPVSGRSYSKPPLFCFLLNA